MDLKKYTVEELEEELRLRRERARVEGKPRVLRSPCFGPVVELCQRYIDDLHTTGWVDDDLHEYIFEAAMTAVFGPAVWNWIKQAMR